MRFDLPLTEARLLRRYKRFLADVDIPGQGEITVLCPNPGSMLGLNPPGARIWLSESDSPTRKYRHTWELLEVDGGIVGINTAHPNAIAAEAIAAGAVPELAGYKSLRREVKYGENSRIDILLENPDGARCYVEIKNVHLMREPGLAEFPDSVTKRGAKHLRELTAMVAEGHRAAMFYLVQRGDCRRFSIAEDIDPAYAAALREARSHGVEAICYSCNLTTGAIELAGPVEIVF
ncbi:MAG: DNA/RNA nuclease SfsA [Rhodovibrionaceae bacterium]